MSEDFSRMYAEACKCVQGLAVSGRTDLYHDGILLLHEEPSGPPSKSKSATSGSRQVRVLLCNDVIVVVSSDKASNIVAELPWSGIVIHDSLATLDARSPLLNAFSISSNCKPATSTTAPAASMVLVAPTSDDKEKWRAAFSKVLQEVTPADAQMDQGWIHRIITGTVHWAAYNDDVATLKHLGRFTTAADTTAAVDLNAIDVDGNAALHVAVKRGNRDMVAALLELGAAPDVADSDFMTPLHIAAGACDADICALLMVNGAPLDSRNLLEQTPLSFSLGCGVGYAAEAAAAARDSRSEALAVHAGPAALPALVGLMLSYNHAVLSESDGEGLYPIHRAALTPFSAVVTSMVKHGCNADVKALIKSQGVDGDLFDDALTALHLACGVRFEGDPRATLNFTRPGDDLEDGNSAAAEGSTGGVDARFLSTAAVHVSVVKSILEGGCQPNARTQHASQTALHIILASIQALAAIASTIDASRKGEFDSTRAQLQAAASILCSYGARLDIADGSGVSCADMASKLNLKTSLEASCSLFASRQPPSNASKADALAFGESAFADLGKQHLAGAGGRGGAAAAAWKSDASSNSCLICGADFTVARRRHHCRNCGLLVCDACSRKRYPINGDGQSSSADAVTPPPSVKDAGADRARDPDSDDDDAPTRPASSSNKAASAGNGSAAMKESIAKAKAGFSTFFKAITTAPAPSGGASSPQDAAGSADRVCDGCFNGLCMRAEVRASEAKAWQDQKDEALKHARNMADGATDSSVKRIAGNTKSSFELFAGQRSTATKPSADEERSALFSGSTAVSGDATRQPATAASANARASSLQNQLEGTKARLAERGEKISRLDERTREMANDAENFASMAEKLKKRSAGGWFGF